MPKNKVTFSGKINSLTKDIIDSEQDDSGKKRRTIPSIIDVLYQVIIR